MTGAIYLIAGIVIILAGMVLIGWQRRRVLGSVTLFVGLNLTLLGYALLRGMGE